MESKIKLNYVTKDILTPAECQKILGIGRNTVYSLLKDKSLKSIKFGSKYIVPKQFVEDYLNSFYTDSI